MKKHLKALALVRDAGAANMISPMLRELRDRGHWTVLLAEASGQAKNFLHEDFFETDEEKLAFMLTKVKPNVVITGLAFERHLESKLDRWAKHRRIPLVNIEDYWGTAQRAPVRADLIITVDEISARLARMRCPGSRVAIAGFAGILPVVPRASLVAECVRIWQGMGARIVVYPDCGVQTEESLPMIVESIMRSSAPIMLAPKYHPHDRLSSHPRGGTWEEWCNEQIKPLRALGLVHDFDEPAAEVVEIADATFSSFSTLLMRAAKAGKVAVTTWNEPVRARLKEVADLDETPLMMMGGFPILTKAQPLDGILRERPPKLNLAAFDARLAADAIVSLFVDK